jgi:hypothetical protein
LEDQLRGGHLQRACDNGLSESEHEEVTVHMAFYAGWPKAISAITVFKGGLRRVSVHQTTSTEHDLSRIGGATELQIASTRRDGSLRATTRGSAGRRPAATDASGPPASSAT